MERINQKSFRLLKKIKDPKFEIDRLEHYSLSLYMGLKDFQILITDSENNQCLLLEDFIFDPSLSYDEKFFVIKFIIDDHHLLLANFWNSINLIIKNRNFSFVPKGLFIEDKAATYLKVNSAFDSSEDEIMLTYHKQLDMVNVFTVKKEIVDLLSGIYPEKKVRYIHQSSTLINGVIKKNQNGQRDTVIYIDRFGLHILVASNKKLEFYNQYAIKKFNDYLKYIKMVAKELNINLEQDEIKLYGYLGQDTPHFGALKKSLHQLTLGERPENLNFGYVFDEVLEHQYFDIFSADTFRV